MYSTSQLQHQHAASEEGDIQHDLESSLLGLFQSLTELQTVSGSVVPGSNGLVAGAASRTISSIAQTAVLKSRITAKVPVEVLDLIDASKNPHQHTRNLVEQVAGENQFTNGKIEAISTYHDQLSASLYDAFPELKAFSSITSLPTDGRTS